MPPVYGGLTYRSVDIQTENLFFDVTSSLYEPAEHRGRDDVVPGRAGRYRRNRVADRRLVILQGYTLGTGSDPEARRESWNDAEAALGALLDPSAAPGALVAIAPYMGLPSGSYSLSAAVLNWTAGDVDGSMSFRRWTVELEAIDDPPDWVEDAS